MKTDWHPTLYDTKCPKCGNAFQITPIGLPPKLSGTTMNPDAHPAANLLWQAIEAAAGCEEPDESEMLHLRAAIREFARSIAVAMQTECARVALTTLRTVSMPHIDKVVDGIVGFSTPEFFGEAAQ